MDDRKVVIAECIVHKDLPVRLHMVVELVDASRCTKIVMCERGWHVLQPIEQRRSIATHVDEHPALPHLDANRG